VSTEAAEEIGNPYTAVLPQVAIHGKVLDLFGGQVTHMTKDYAHIEFPNAFSAASWAHTTGMTDRSRFRDSQLFGESAVVFVRISK
jgi:hypothetical protein